MILPIQHLHYEVAKGGDRVGANERRLAILHSLCRQGETTASALAHEYSVSTRTIRSDMLTLARVYPIVSRRGQNGCYSLAEWYDPSQNLLTSAEINLLYRLQKTLSDEDALMMSVIMSKVSGNRILDTP